MALVIIVHQLQLNNAAINLEPNTIKAKYALNRRFTKSASVSAKP